jgi:translocation and assembly module TamB
MLMHMKKRLLIASLMLLAPLLLVSMAIGWLCYTASGLQFALLQLNRVPNLTVQVTGVSGKIAGPLHVDHIILEHERVHIDIQQLDIDLTPALLLSGLVEINRLGIAQIRATLKPAVTDKPDRPIHFLPSFLRVSIDQLELQQATYQHINGYTIIATPLHATASLSRSRLQLTNLDAITKEFDARGELTVDSEKVLTLQATLATDYRLANGPVLRGNINATGPVTGSTRQLTLEALLHEPHDATIKGVLAFPDSGWSLQGNASADQVLLDAWWQQPTFSFSKLGMQFKLSGDGMHYVGDLLIPEWSNALLHVDADTRYAQRVLTLDRADVSVPQSGITTRTTGTITMNQGAKPRLDLRSSWTNLQWPLHASANQATFTSTQGTFNLNGTQPYQFELAAQVTLPTWQDSTVQASGELHADAIQLDNFKLHTLQGLATGSALVGLGTNRHWQFDLRGENLNPATRQTSLQADSRTYWPGRLNIQASGKGQGFNAQAQFDVQVRSLTGTLRDQTVTAKGRLQRQGQHWLAEGVDARWGRAQLTAQGTVGPQNNLQWTLNAPALQQLHPDLAGELIMSGKFSGEAAAPQLSLLAQAANLRYGTWQATGLKLDTQLDVTDRSNSRIHLTATRVAYQEQGLEQLQLTGAGQVANHQLSLQATLDAAPLPENMQLDLQLAGSFAKQQWRGSVNTVQLIDADKVTRLNLLQPTPLSVSTHAAELQATCLALDTGRVCTNGKWFSDTHGNPSWSMRTTLHALPISISNTALSNNARLQAIVDAEFDMSARAPQTWEGIANLKLSEAGIHYKSISGRNEVLPITMGELHLSADQLNVDANAELRISEQTVSTLTARIDRSIGKDMRSWPLNGLLSLSSSDAKLIPVFISEVDRASGTLASVLQLSGTPAEPNFDGIVRLLQGELDFYQLNLALRGIEFDGQVKTDQLQFSAQANAGEGLLNGNGDLSWRDAKLFGNLQLKGDKLLVADLPEYRVLTSPDLRFEINDKTINVKGEVLIPEARLQPREVIGAVQASTDARYKNEIVSERSQSAWTVNSETTIRLGDKINFNGLGLQGQLSGIVATRSRNGNATTGTGELNINGGSYEIYGQKLDITRGRLIYDSTALGNPGLNIQAERKIDATTVGVNVRGVLNAPRLQFYSNDPDASQTQIVSYLLIGKPLEDLQSGEATTVRSASNTLALEGGGYLASQLGRRIGLDQVGVETDTSNDITQQQLVLGKFLSPRLFVSYGISLTEAINTVKLRYTLSDRWTVKTEAGAAKSADIEFKIER